MGSERLPGKVLKPVLGDLTLIDCHLDRLERSNCIDQIIVATTLEQGDDVLVQHLESRGINVFRGAYLDVLDRYYQCAKQSQAAYVLRTTSDCPFIDPALIDDLATAFFQQSSADYADISHECIPRGFDAEIVTFNALTKAFDDAVELTDREHVLPYIWRRPDVFQLQSYKPDIDGADLRLCVDEPADLKLIEQIIDQYGHSILDASCKDIIQFIRKNPSLAEINKNVLQKKV